MEQGFNLHSKKANNSSRLIWPSLLVSIFSKKAFTLASLRGVSEQDCRASLSSATLILPEPSLSKSSNSFLIVPSRTRLEKGFKYWKTKSRENILETTRTHDITKTRTTRTAARGVVRLDYILNFESVDWLSVWANAKQWPQTLNHNWLIAKQVDDWCHEVRLSYWLVTSKALAILSCQVGVNAKGFSQFATGNFLQILLIWAWKVNRMRILE